MTDLWKRKDDCLRVFNKHCGFFLKKNNTICSKNDEKMQMLMCIKRYDFRYDEFVSRKAAPVFINVLN
jgi:hypothetical protein